GVGSAVSGWAEGDRVCFDSTIFCNACEACQKGAYNRCTKRQVLGVSVPGMRRDGAFAEYVTVPAWSVAPLAAHLSFDEATLFEPLSIALHAVHRGAVASDEVVLILGCGTIGLLAIAAARQRGAGRILATDVRPERLQRARSLGADEVVDVS